jgi:hypothetical protein
MRASEASLRQRILDAAREHPSPSRSEAKGRALAVMAAAISVSVSIFLYAGGFRQGPRPTELVLLTSMITALLAAVAAYLGGSRGGTMMGRPARALWMVIVLAPIALFAWKWGISRAFEDMTREWADRVGWRCFRWSLAMGALPLLALCYLRRDSVLTRPATVGAALGVGVGALVWVPVDLWCPVAYAPHLLLGHVMPTVIFGSIGAGLGVLLLAMRR